jgi:hypothetical protein
LNRARALIEDNQQITKSTIKSNCQLAIAHCPLFRSEKAVLIRAIIPAKQWAMRNGQLAIRLI